MTALSNQWCEDNPLSCGVIQRTLEKSPGLRFVNGEFRHTYDMVSATSIHDVATSTDATTATPQVSPSPPPPPTPPPRTLFCEYHGTRIPRRY
jgi:hypothetical protein